MIQLFENFDQLERKVQSFAVVANPTFLALSQLVTRGLDFSEEELVVPIYQQIGPARTAAPIVFDEIPKHFNEANRRKDVDQLPGNSDLFIPMRPRCYRNTASAMPWNASGPRSHGRTCCTAWTISMRSKRGFAATRIRPCSITR